MQDAVHSSPSEPNLLEVMYRDGVVQSLRLIRESSAESRLKLVQFSVDVSLRRRHVIAHGDMADVFGAGSR